MPRALKFVFLVMTVCLTISLGGLVWSATQQDQVSQNKIVATVVGMTIQFLVLCGLFTHAPWAWTAARILTFIGIAFQLLSLILVFLVMRSEPIAALILSMSGGITLALEFAVFIALGRPSVRRHFFRR